MAYGILDLSKNLVGIKPDATRLGKDEFWALNDIGFELKRGEIIGIIGRNGSGKTTLLRILSGIFPPDKGEVSIRGRVASLIAVGAGFHPHMTGRENIYLNGTILGMTRQQLDAKYASIVDFAEVDDFINAPISTYSSGMRVRLGFSVAINISPDILLIDEVLAVGDQAFKQKAQLKIKELLGAGVSVIFVSHNLTQVARLCSYVMHLDKGRIKAFGDANEVVSSYMIDSKDEYAFQPLTNPDIIMAKAEFTEFDKLKIHSIQFFNQNEKEAPIFQTLDDLILKICFEVRMPINKLFFEFRINSDDGSQLIKTKSEKKIYNSQLPIKDVISCQIPRLPLRRGRYSIDILAGDEDGLTFKSRNIAEIKIDNHSDNVVELHDPSLLKLDSSWSFCK